MKYLILILSSLIISVPSFAAVGALIPSQSKAIIVVQGPDNDAFNIYKNMNVTPKQYPSGFLKKKIISTSGQVSISCTHSELPEMVSCIISVLAGATETHIDPEEKVVFIDFWGDEGNQLFEKFNKNLNGQKLLLQTEDQKLSISGKNGNFSIEYKYTR